MTDYIRTNLIITEFDSEDIIMTSGEVNIPLNEYEGKPIIDD